MQEIKNQFFINNNKKANRIVLLFILAMNSVPLALTLLTLIGIFEIPLLQLLGLLILTVSITVFDFLLTRKDSTQIYAKYCGLLFVNSMVCYVGINPNIQISIVFALCPIISCLYYDSKFTLHITIFSYVLMVVSMYFKSFGIVEIMNYKNRTEPLAWFFPEIVGLTMQYAFACIVAWMFTNQSKNSLNNVLDLNEKVVIANNQLDKKNTELEDTQYKIIQFVAQVLGSHDLFTGRHVIHTQRYVEIICKKLRENGHYTDILTDENIKMYSTAAFLHDIGKVHIPEGVLNKVGKYTDEEFSIMKHHPEEGMKLLEFLPPIADRSFNDIAIKMAYCHHEKWNGTGYPRFLKGEQIPLCARIMAAADVLDALLSRRLYKEPMSIDEAIHIFEETKGTHFEPCIAAAVVDCKDEIVEIDAEFKKTEEESNVEELEWWKKYSSARLA